MSDVLCYVDSCWACFTSQPLRDQWGDDWNDAPYEHNAGNPYAFDEYAAKEGREPWQIVRVAFRANLETPGAHVLNSGYSVEDINNRVVPWLQSGKYGDRDEQGNPIQIWAGATIEEFIALIKKAGGEVYLLREPPRTGGPQGGRE